MRLSIRDGHYELASIYVFIIVHTFKVIFRQLFDFFDTQSFSTFFCVNFKSERGSQSEDAFYIVLCNIIVMYSNSSYFFLF